MEFAEMLNRQLVQITDEIKVELEAASSDLADKAQKELTQKSPRSDMNHKHYADGWRVDEDTSYQYGTKIFKVHNVNKPHLTYILNNGHGSKSGKWHPGDEHIDRVQEMIEDEIKKKVVEVVDKVTK